MRLCLSPPGMAFRSRTEGNLPERAAHPTVVRLAMIVSRPFLVSPRLRDRLAKRSGRLRPLGRETARARYGATQRKLAASSMLPSPVWRATWG